MILAPNSSKYEDLNNYSVVVKLTFGDTSFIFTGDAGIQSEGEMITGGFDLKADVLKIGHHGSSDSTSSLFLKMVEPDYAVISVGKDNSCGHPDPETVNGIIGAGIKLYRTDEAGTIIATSDGTVITFNVKESPDKAETPPVISEDPSDDDSSDKDVTEPYGEYIGNKNTKKFHDLSCSYLPAEKNRVYFKTRKEAIKKGYKPCGHCNP